MKILIKGYEWGPGVPKVILKLEQGVSEITAEHCLVITAGEKRTVTDVYASDENGRKTDRVSVYVTIEMKTVYEECGSPFDRNPLTCLNEWKEHYEVTVSCPDFTADGKEMPLFRSEDCIGHRICPDIECFRERSSFTGIYENAFTGAKDRLTLQTAAYSPEQKNRDTKLPLLIWLHGQGEGGTDPDIALLGNKVSALAGDEIQSCFSSGEEQGAHVLAVQCSTYWMDEGDERNGNGSGTSRYTGILMDTIRDYVRTHPGVDRKRIYLGGCSNGGYMTIHMLLHYPDEFAAAYPCCEAYAFYEYERETDGSYRRSETGGVGTSAFVRTGRRWMTDEKIRILKKIPIWWILSADDPIVLPEYFELPAYRELLQAGAENAWLSLFESVEGTDSPGTAYGGHLSWIYLFNNQVNRVQDREAVASSKDCLTFGTTASNQGGGSCRVGSGKNIFEWLNEQVKK